MEGGPEGDAPGRPVAVEGAGATGAAAAVATGAAAAAAGVMEDEAGGDNAGPVGMLLRPEAWRCGQLGSAGGPLSSAELRRLVLD